MPDLEQSPRPLRFVFFGRSVVSDWNNPAARVSREVLRAVNKLGHETRFLEERGNQPTVDLLKARGSTPLREFTKQYPDIVYRTYELPKGLERTVWLAREIGDVDVAVVLDDAPQGIFDEMSRVPLRRMVRVILQTDDVPPPFEPDLIFRLPVGMSGECDMTRFAAELVAAVRNELSSRR